MAPLEESVYFAGKATSMTAFATAHGAWLSGYDAARSGAAKRIRALNRPWGVAILRSVTGNPYLTLAGEGDQRRRAATTRKRNALSRIKPLASF